MAAALRVGFVSGWRHDDPNGWSGVISPMYAALAERVDLVPMSTADLGDALVDRAYCRIVGDRFGTYLPGHALASSLRHGRVVTEWVRERQVDVVLGVAASVDVAFLGTSVPVVQVSDVTFAAVQSLYPLYADLSPVLAVQGRTISRRMTRRVSRTLAASDWAKERLVLDDGVAPESIDVAPFGPAISAAAVGGQPVAVAQSGRGPWRLLVVAKDWYRKGGDRAVEAARLLAEGGLAVELRVVGAAAEEVVVPTVEPAGSGSGSGSLSVSRLGRLDKEALAREYAAAHALLDLTRGSAAGVTLTDAAEFGLPSVATRYGGVGSIVVDGQTGYLVDPDGDVAGEAARVLHALFGTPGAQTAMSRAARERAASILSWAAWADVAVASLSRARDASS